MTDIVDLSIPRDGAAPPAAPEAGAGELEARLRPALETLDAERRKQKSEFVFRIAVSVLGMAALCVLSGLVMVGMFGAALQSLDFWIHVVPLMLALGAFAFWANKPHQQYVTAYKSRVLPVVAESLGRFTYDESGRISEDRLLGSTLLPNYDKYKSEDRFKGTYKDVDVDLAEVKLTKKKGSGKNRRTVTVFKGLFVLLETHKAFSGKTVVKRDAGAIANWLGEKFGGMERVSLEDPEFEKHFEVYATDQVEARYLLTPAFMERLTALANDMGGGRLQAAFYDDKLFVMVPNTGNLFEPPSIFKSVLQHTGVARIARELGDVLSMIDTLKLTERTGL